MLEKHFKTIREIKEGISYPSDKLAMSEIQANFNRAFFDNWSKDPSAITQDQAELALNFLENQNLENIDREKARLWFRYYEDQLVMLIYFREVDPKAYFRANNLSLDFQDIIDPKAYINMLIMPLKDNIIGQYKELQKELPNISITAVDLDLFISDIVEKIAALGKAKT